MKRLFIVLATMLLLTITACTPGGWGDPQKQYRLHKTSNYTAEDTLISYHMYSYDSNNRLITDAYYDASDALQRSYVFAYDGSDRLSTASVYNQSSVLLGYGQYSYNGSGLVERLTFYVSGNPYFYNAYEYDSSGKSLGGATYTPLDVLMSYWGYEYNTNGVMEKVMFYDASGNTTSYLTFDYDADGKIATEWIWNSLDTLTQRNDFSYDADGKVIKVSGYIYQDGNPVLQGYKTYEYEGGSSNYNVLDSFSSFSDFYAVMSTFFPG